MRLLCLIPVRPLHTHLPNHVFLSIYTGYNLDIQFALFQQRGAKKRRVLMGSFFLVLVARYNLGDTDLRMQICKSPVRRHAAPKRKHEVFSFQANREAKRYLASRAKHNHYKKEELTSVFCFIYGNIAK